MQVSGSTTRRLGALGMLVALAALLVVAPSAYAHPVDDSVDVLPPNSRVSGKTLGEWSAVWWQYVFSIPAADNPLLDPTGARCGEEQSGKVFFLVGTISGSATRNKCAVPEGRMLFFPLINLEDNAAEEAVSPIVDAPPTARKMTSLLNCLVAGGSTPFAPAFKTCQGVTELHATIDGVALHNLSAFRATSSPFRIRVPSSPNLEGAFGFPGISGTVFPVVADGYYLMLAPLSPGPHTITFGGTFGAELGFGVDVTYHLNVVSR